MAASFVLHIVLFIQIQLCMTAIYLAVTISCKDGFNTEITDPPVSESGLLYTIVKFSCKGIGDCLTWSVAHSTLTCNTEKQEQNINITTSKMSGNLSSNLTILALPTNNKIEIGCIVTSFMPFMVAGKEAVLTVTGVSPVVNVQWHSGPSLLTWSPPFFFYSNDSSNHAEFEYDILLNGVYMINTTSTSAYLNISTCLLFNVSITVYTDQYVSQENDQIYFNSGNYTVKIINRTVKFDQETDTVNINLTISVKFTDYECNNTIYVTGSAISNEDGEQMSYPSLEANSNKSKEIILHYEMNNLTQNAIYTIVIHVTDFFNVTEAQDNIKISTHIVDDFSIDVNSNGSLTVTCVFMQGSINESCYLIFSDTAQGIKEHFTLAGNANITLTESGNYTVEVYGLFNGEIYGPVFEYPEFIEVIIISPSASSEQPTTTVYTTTSLSTNIITPSSIITPTSSNDSTDISSVTIIIIIAAVFGGILFLWTVLGIALALYYIRKNEPCQHQNHGGIAMETVPGKKDENKKQPSDKKDEETKL